MSAEMFHARQSDTGDTQFFAFKIVREWLDGSDSSGDVTADIGQSPVDRWLAYCLDCSEVASTVTEVTAPIPAGSTILSCFARVDKAVKDASDANVTLQIGDDAQTAGWMDGLNVGDVSGDDRIRYDDTAVYNAGDASHGVTGPQYYEHGGILTLTFSATPAEGYLIVFLETPSYNEVLENEWS